MRLEECVYLVAIAHVWARGTIFRLLREWPPLRPLLGCPLCSGFWIGVVGHCAWLTRPVIVEWLGIGSIVGTLTLAVYCAIRRL